MRHYEWFPLKIAHLNSLRIWKSCYFLLSKSVLIETHYGTNRHLRPIIHNLKQRGIVTISHRDSQSFSVGFVIILKVEVWLELWIWIWIRETFLSEITRWVTIQTFCGFTDIVLTYFKSTFFFGFSIGTRFMVSSRHDGSDCMELYKLKSKGCEVWSFNIVHTVPLNKISQNFGPEIPENMLCNNLKWICGWPRGYSLNLEHWIIGKLGQNSYSILIIYSKIP